MYNFSIGGFVINLLTTPGGIDALGLSATFYQSAAIAAVLFVQEQIRVPMVILMPGQAPHRIESITSHLDIPATLLHVLGYQKPGKIYSFGQDLFAENYQRDYTVVGDWHGNALITPHAKIILSLKSSMNNTRLSSIDDAPLDGEELTGNDRSLLKKFVRELPRFYKDSKENRVNAEQLCFLTKKDYAF